MADEVTKKYLEQVAERYKAQVTRMKEEASIAMGMIVEVLEVGFGSFAMGWYHGRRGAMPVYFGVPADAGAGGLLIAAGMIRYSGHRHVFKIGLGVFSYFTGNLGARLGQRMRKSAGELTGTPYATNADGYAVDASGKLIAPTMQVRTITAGMPPGAVPAYGHGVHRQFQPIANW